MDETKVKFRRVLEPSWIHHEKWSEYGDETESFVASDVKCGWGDARMLKWIDALNVDVVPAVDADDEAEGLEEK